VSDRSFRQTAVYSIRPTSIRTHYHRQIATIFLRMKLKNRILSPWLISDLSVLIFNRTLQGFYGPITAPITDAPLWQFMSKTNLGLMRFVNVFALALLVGHMIHPQARFFDSRVARPFVLCGRHSLHLFCLSAILAAFGFVVLSEIFGVMANAVGGICNGYRDHGWCGGATGAACRFPKRQILGKPRTGWNGTWHVRLPSSTAKLPRRLAPRSKLISSPSRRYATGSDAE